MLVCLYIIVSACACARVFHCFASLYYIWIIMKASIHPVFACLLLACPVLNSLPWLFSIFFFHSTFFYCRCRCWCCFSHFSRLPSVCGRSWSSYSVLGRGTPHCLFVGLFISISFTLLDFFVPFARTVFYLVVYEALVYGHFSGADQQVHHYDFRPCLNFRV